MEFLMNNWFSILVTISLVVFLFTKADKEQINNIVKAFIDAFNKKSK